MKMVSFAALCYLSYIFDSLRSGCSSSGMALMHYFSMAPTYLSLCCKQAFHPCPVKFLELSDKGEFQPQSQQSQDSAWCYNKTWVNCAIPSSVQYDKGSTETSLQRAGKAEHGFTIQQKHPHLMQVRDSKGISQEEACTFYKVIFS